MEPGCRQDAESPRRLAPLLGRPEQAVIGAVLAILLAAIGLWYWTNRGRLVEIDVAPPEELEFKVDINEADWPELTLLPGIGETLARRIVQSRRQDGPFRDYRDLQRVRGIGPKTVKAIQPYLLPIRPTEAGDDR